MSYFEFFQLPVAFLLEEEQLKQRFYQNSKLYHPDYYTLASEEKKEQILDLATLNNQAYRTLSDFDKRMEYILRLKGALAEEGSNEVPQDFLLDMMDFNELLLELELNFDPALYQEAIDRLSALEQDLWQAVNPILENYQDDRATPQELDAVKDFYLKKRYLLRIKENLDRFAPL